MKSVHPAVTRSVMVLALAGSLVAASIPAFGNNATGNPATAEDAAARMHERLQTRLARMATRLEISPSQQSAWETYAKAVSAQFSARPARPAADADAATVLRLRAERAASYAQKLTHIADATAQLEAVLSLEQRKTLGEMVRRRGHRHHHHGAHPQNL